MLSAPIAPSRPGKHAARRQRSEIKGPRTLARDTVGPSPRGESKPPSRGSSSSRQAAAVLRPARLGWGRVAETRAEAPRQSFSFPGSKTTESSLPETSVSVQKLLPPPTSDP